MLNQGLYNILENYFSEIDAFFKNLEAFFHQKIQTLYNKINNEPNCKEASLTILKNFIMNEFISFGFSEKIIQTNLRSPKTKYALLKLMNCSFCEFKSTVISIFYEIIFNKILKYLVNGNFSETIINLKSRNLLPVAFLMELNNLKTLVDNSIQKKTLQRYLEIQNNIIKKLVENCDKINNVQKVSDPADKLQFFYMLYRIIDFFNIQHFFDLEGIKEYIRLNVDEWLFSLPLVSLKNPELYHCGIFLARKMAIRLTEDDEDNIKYFLLMVYDELIDEFESPLIEATEQLYYFLKAVKLSGLVLSELQIKELLKINEEYFTTSRLKDFETSKLVIILKIYKMLGFLHIIPRNRIHYILEEIDSRITPEGIQQYREGFNSSEAIYYVYFCFYMRNSLKHLKDINIINSLLSIIYRNLQIVNLNHKMNYDLISEIFYACEGLKLINCIEHETTLEHLLSALFPKDILNKGSKKSLPQFQYSTKLAPVKVSEITGDIKFN
ncbi:MAG: hypothetical protein ACTSR8_15725 [Promethearchaeota archaeon]